METQDEAVAIVKAREVQQRASTQMRAQMQECPAERDRYLAVMHRERELTESTLKFRKAAINHLVKFTQATTPRQITPRQVSAWVDALKKQNPETAINYLSVAQSWFSWLQQGFKINSNPASQVKPPKKPTKGRKQFLRPEEARKLITAATGDRDLTFALYCALHAGLRRKEVIEARPSWFDLDAGLLHVQATPTFVPKDKDNRTIPLTKEFREWLRKNYTMQEPSCCPRSAPTGRAPTATTSAESMSGCWRGRDCPRISTISGAPSRPSTSQRAPACTR
ncbi:tyrosine-type recombinase/integrase [Verrucomicrobium spinosum]|uniref:tyrosine-type recombinase/integrase n=1 Tax=Verrucomicrobium spinosum TaxID=2736 RepID=UPI0009463694|nr:phage integrase N-terminal SAM-like domain-containing protein [Verrucomicrobium spinosum]